MKKQSKGDVEAIVVVDNTANKARIKRNYRVLSHLHTLDGNVKELDRVERKGCNLINTLNGKKKIAGLFDITRCLGLYGHKEVKSYVSAVPSVKSYKIESNFICLIIASKGLWDVLNYSQVSELVLQVF